MREGFVHLGDVCIISGGYTPKPSQLFPEGDIPYFKVADMNRIGNEISLCYTDQYLKEARKTFPKGAIVFPKNGGAVATNKKRILAHDAVVDLNTGIAIPGERVDNQYLFYYFQGIDFKRFIKDGTLPVLRTKEIAELPFYSPALPEQQRIVDILDQEFARIDALKANAEKSLQAAKDLFQATLKKELEPKEGWKKKRLDEICEITAELIDPTLPEYIDQIHIGGANIIAETGVLIDLKTSREENLISGKFPFDETMVLYSKIRPYLKKVCCPDFQGICSADIYPLKPNQDVDRTYLYYILLSQDFTDYAILGSARAGMPKVNRPYMFAYSCSIPEYEEQCKVANRLDAVREQTNALQDNYQKTLTLCDDLKQSLLRKTFNGEL